MARGSSSGPARTVFLLLGEDPYRARLRLAELVAALTSFGDAEASDLARRPSPDLGAPIGVTRLDARTDAPAAIVLAARSQGLFQPVGERAVVIVEHAEALRDLGFLREFPEDAALVLVAVERLPSRSRRGAARAGKRAAESAEATTAAELPDAVAALGGRVERIARLADVEVASWVAARAALRGVELAPAAAAALMAAVGTDTDRCEQELAKLAAYAAGKRVEAADIRALVPGAIEADVFALTQAVVRADARAAVAGLERLLADGQAPQQILALLVWQFRVLLFASAMRTNDDAARMAKAIRSTPGAIGRWQAFAKRVTRADVTRAYESLYATDLAIKQGRTEPETALLLCVLDLCGVRSADPRELVVGEPPRR